MPFTKIKKRCLSMGINLEKGGTINLNKCIDLTKRPAGLNKLIVGLGWDVNKGYGADYDLDAMAALLDENGVLRTTADFIYFGNKHGKGCYSTGDNLTGEGEGDDEQLIVTLDEVPDYVKSISFAVVIYQAKSKHQKFGHIDNSFIRVVDYDSNTELCRYDLGHQFSSEVGVVVGDLEKIDGEWRFKAIGQGFNDVTYDSLRDMYRKPGNYTDNQGTSNYSATNTPRKKSFLDRLFGR